MIPCVKLSLKTIPVIKRQTQLFFPCRLHNFFLRPDPFISKLSESRKMPHLEHQVRLAGLAASILIRVTISRHVRTRRSVVKRREPKQSAGITLKRAT
jgi:hypothetical protein